MPSVSAKQRDVKQKCTCQQLEKKQ